jgi:hypothetical protein
MLVVLAAVACGLLMSVVFFFFFCFLWFVASAAAAWATAGRAALRAPAQSRTIVTKVKDPMAQQLVSHAKDANSQTHRRPQRGGGNDADGPTPGAWRT